MFNSSTLPPNTPPTMSRSQKEKDAASSLLELQQSFSNSNTGQPSSGMNSPASSPTELNPPLTTANQQYSAPISIRLSSQQTPKSDHYELIMLPSIFRQRESAVRSTLSRSLPVFGTLLHEEDEELRKISAIQNDSHLGKEQAQTSLRKQQKLPLARHHAVYQVQRSLQGPSSQPLHPQSHQVTQAQAFAHAQAQAYYLAHARVQTYGYPQPDQSVSHCKSQEQQPARDKYLQQQHHHHKKQPQQQQQPVINHHVRAVEDRRSSQPWPEPNSNRNKNTFNTNDQASMQNSFSIRGDGVHIQRSILHEDQQSLTPVPARQSQVVDRSSPQQMNHRHHQQQKHQEFVAAQRSIGPEGISQSKLPVNSVVFYHPMDPSKAHSSNYIAQQVHAQREAIQQQAHKQAVQQAVKRASQYLKQQRQQQQQHSPHQQTNLQHHQYVMHQHKESSRQNRELMAQHESLPHRKLQTPQQPQPQEERAITISPSTTSETVLTTEADEDEEMYELEDDKEEDDEYFEEEDDDSDPDFQSFSKSTEHMGGSSNSNNHHHGNNSKKDKSVKEKPRWTPQMRESLLKAVIAYKNLDDMTSFHWSQIGKQVGRSGKACKDQWRRALLPKIQQTFDRCDQDFTINASGSSSYPASLQPPPQQRTSKQ
ncbi:hypothetical protein G6F42_016951 [Rhizopus arrhizus]|nr:hypothetical protein G6F42_016951 [Rhizopus arrhizus]